jgi:hypothetical protein
MAGGTFQSKKAESRREGEEEMERPEWWRVIRFILSRYESERSENIC